MSSPRVNLSDAFEWACFYVVCSVSFSDVALRYALVLKVVRSFYSYTVWGLSVVISTSTVNSAVQLVDDRMQYVS